LATRSYGVGTVADLADYYRHCRSARAHPRIAELVEAGRSARGASGGWREAAFLYCGAKAPARIDASALLSPFDPVIWLRGGVPARLFEFDYRSRFLCPPRRGSGGVMCCRSCWGRLVARVIEADRAGRRLLVLSAHLEEGEEVDRVAGALAAELRTMAGGWVGAGGVGRRGELARALKAAM